ncbi:hypothetical protein [Erythrobacter sp. NFXS35]|uniref:hypothetical protein n=1 Tax=Erythrobacter sp. NFXS35 TaxID=2818436 RepID=UPI0032DF3698
MESRRDEARRQFKQMLLAIFVISGIVLAAVLWWMSTQGDLRLHMVIATIAGVFASMLLGAGLMALAFYSSKSGKDDDAGHAARGRDKPKKP